MCRIRFLVMYFSEDPLFQANFKNESVKYPSSLLKFVYKKAKVLKFVYKKAKVFTC